MPLWVWMVLLAALIKLPIAGLLLWVPFRYDESMHAPEAQDSSEEDGGSKALPGGPTDPHPRSPLPRSPRRGPHGDPAPPAPARIRTAVRSRRRVGVAL
jgi:hypothetical protein